MPVLAQSGDRVSPWASSYVPRQNLGNASTESKLNCFLAESLHVAVYRLSLPSANGSAVPLGSADALLMLLFHVVTLGMERELK